MDKRRVFGVIVIFILIIIIICQLINIFAPKKKKQPVEDEVVFEQNYIDVGNVSYSTLETEPDDTTIPIEENNAFSLDPADNQYESKPNRDSEKVTLSIEEGTLTTTGCTLIIKDENAIPYGWGEAYLIQEVTENAYGELKPKNELVFTDIGYVPNQENIIKQRINWNNFYGSLKPGKYRLVKPMYDPDTEGYINFMVGFEIK